MTNSNVKFAGDEDLMLRYAAGDLEAFQRLYELHRGGLYRYFLRQTNRAVAEELFQDVWARLIKHRKRYRPDASFKTWLYTLAHNRLVDYWRREGRRAIDQSELGEAGCDIEFADPDPGPQRRVDLRDCLEQLLQLVTALPDLQRQAFLLRHEAGMTLAQIAEAMNSGAETAKSRLRYAMDRLRSAIAKECLESET
jgi:RNA polymerase sigma-70 factor (ECF subfamily)